METYHKINAPFKRYLDGPKKGRLILGDWAIPELAYLAKNTWEFTEKVDGTNIRIGCGYDASVRFGGRSDNAVIPKPLLEHLEATFTTERFRAAGLGEEAGMVTLFGEGYGPKIQGGGKYRDDHSFVLFDVKIGDFWLDRNNVNDIADKLDIESVPVIGTGTIETAIDIVTTGYSFSGPRGLKSYGRNGLRSAWGDFEAEGIVARPTVPLFNRKGERILTKIKAVDFR